MLNSICKHIILYAISENSFDDEPLREHIRGGIKSAVKPELDHNHSHRAYEHTKWHLNSYPRYRLLGEKKYCI